MDSSQGTLVINPNSQEWYTLDKMEKTPPNPLTFYEDWDSVKLDGRPSWSSQGKLWPASSKEKDKQSRVGTHRASIALLVVVCFLSVASLALSILMLFGIIGSLRGSCACAKQEPTPSTLASYSSKLEKIGGNLATLQAELGAKDVKIDGLLQRVAQLEEGTDKVAVGALKTRLNVTTRKLQTLEETLNKSMDNMHSALAHQLYNVSQELGSTKRMLQRAVEEVYENITARDAAYRQEVARLNQSLSQTRTRLKEFKNNTTIKTAEIQNEVAQLWLNANYNLRCCNNLSAVTQKLAVQVSSDVRALWTQLNVTNQNLQTSSERLNKSIDILAKQMNAAGELLRLSDSQLEHALQEVNVSFIFQLNNVTQELRSTEASLHRAVGEVYENMTATYATHLQEVSNLSQSLIQTKTQLKGLKSDTDSKTVEIEGMMTHLWRSVNSSLRCCGNLSVFTENQAQQMNRTFFSLRSADAKLERNVEAVNTSLNKKTAHLAASLIEVSVRANETELALDEFRGNTTSELKKLNSSVFSISEAETRISGALQDVNSSLLLQLRNSSKSPGPPGPAGFNGSRGPPGPQGSGNFSLCRYDSKKNQGSPGPTANINVFLPEPADKRIVGATCSAQGASEYQLTRVVLGSARKYKCTCKGESKLFKPSADNKLYCYIHYWECPLTTK